MRPFYLCARSTAPCLTRLFVLRSIGIAYAGTGRLDIMEKLLTVASDTSLSMEIASMASLALGFIFVGSGNGDVTGAILQTMMEREEKQLSEKWTRFMSLGLALLYLGACRLSCRAPK